MDDRTIQDRIRAGEFENVLPYPSEEVLDNDLAWRALALELAALKSRIEEIDCARKLLCWNMRAHYDEESFTKREAFRAALEEEYGLQDHPKRNEIWRKAWDDGHSGGWSAIFCEYDELADLLS